MWKERRSSGYLLVRELEGVFGDVYGADLVGSDRGDHTAQQRLPHLQAQSLE
jgi:hypothetical protein